MRAVLTIFLLVTQVYAQSFVSHTVVEGMRNFSTLAIQPDGIVVITGNRMRDTLQGSFIKVDHHNKVKKPIPYLIITNESYLWEQWLWHPEKRGILHIKETKNGFYPYHLTTSLTGFSKGLKKIRVQKSLPFVIDYARTTARGTVYFFALQSSFQEVERLFGRLNPNGRIDTLSALPPTGYQRSPRYGLAFGHADSALMTYTIGDDSIYQFNLCVSMADHQISSFDGRGEVKPMDILHETPYKNRIRFLKPYWENEFYLLAKYDKYRPSRDSVMECNATFGGPSRFSKTHNDTVPLLYSKLSVKVGLIDPDDHINWHTIKNSESLGPLREAFEDDNNEPFWTDHDEMSLYRFDLPTMEFVKLPLLIENPIKFAASTKRGIYTVHYNRDNTYSLVFHGYKIEHSHAASLH